MEIKQLSLPRKYMITGNYNDKKDFQNKLEYQLLNGIKLVQIRAKNSPEEEFLNLSEIAINMAKKFDSVKIILNTKPELAKSLNADGIHLTTEYLMNLQERPMPLDRLVCAACHDIEQLKKAQDLKVDFVTLSPVLHTDTHPEAIPLGWEKFSDLCKNYPIPVFALGGMQNHTLESAQSYGAYGLASLSWWSKSQI